MTRLDTSGLTARRQAARRRAVGSLGLTIFRWSYSSLDRVGAKTLRSKSNATGPEAHVFDLASAHRAVDGRERHTEDLSHLALGQQLVYLQQICWRSLSCRGKAYHLQERYVGSLIEHRQQARGPRAAVLPAAEPLGNSPRRRGLADRADPSPSLAMAQDVEQCFALLQEYGSAALLDAFAWGVRQHAIGAEYVTIQLARRAPAQRATS
jgi:hypothetical protein